MKILCNRLWKSALNLRSQITLLLFLTWKFHINYPGSNICVTICSYLTQHSHTVSFHSNVCGRLAKGENRHHSLYKHMLTNISSWFNFFFFQLLCLSRFIDLLPPSKLLIKNYESHFPSDEEWDLTGIQSGRYTAKVNWLQPSALYAFLNFSVLSKLTVPYLTYACFNCVWGSIPPCTASELIYSFSNLYLTLNLKRKIKAHSQYWEKCGGWKVHLLTNI